MRIISGTYKGREISSPQVAGTHPMGERERLAVFNMINGWLPEATVLDAYAGSGALGIEALSRGAASAVFLERSPRVANVIRDNLRRLGADGQVIIGDVAKYATNASFDVIFADPPYDNFQLSGVKHLTYLLKDGGVFVLSHPGEAPELQGITLDKTRKYAGAHISVYTK